MKRRWLALALLVLCVAVTACGGSRARDDGSVELLHFRNGDGEWTFRARMATGGRANPAPEVNYVVPGSGGGSTLVAVPCGGWPLELRVQRVGETDVVFGVAIDDAVAVRYPRIGRQTGIIWTRRLPGLPLRWFAVRLHAHEVQGDGNDFEALDARGRELGSMHDNRGDGSFPPFDGRWERRFRKRQIPGCR